MGLFGIKSKAEKAAEQEMNKEWISVQKQLSKFLENQTLPGLDSYKKIDITTPVTGTFDRFNVQNCSYINGKTTVGYVNSFNLDLPIDTWISGIVLHQIKPGVLVEAGTRVACIINNLETALEIIKKLTDKESGEAELKAQEEGKLTERYNKVMPTVKRYLDSIGFELPPDENVFFMEIDENTGKWKYEVTFNLKVNEWIVNSEYDSYWKDDPDAEPDDRCKYTIEEVEKETPSANGILLTPDGKAYIGAIQGNQTFWRHREDGKGVDNSFQPIINNVLAVGNITSQLLCGLHIKAADSKKVPEKDQTSSGRFYTNNTEDKMYDYYWSSQFPKSVKRVFIFPSDEYEKRNTVTLGSAFNNCSNLRLFYCGFDKCEHEKFLCENSTYKVFADDSHADFISPSKDCLEFFNAEAACKNWNFKVGTTIQNAVSSAEAEKAEAAALSEALKTDEEAKLAETKAVLEQLEEEVAAKKTQVASLGLDAQGIVQKAKLNKEIKDLEPQIETLKAEVEKLSK